MRGMVPVLEVSMYDRKLCSGGFLSVLRSLGMMAASYVCWIHVGKGDRAVLLCSGAPRLGVDPLLSWLLWLRYMDTGLAGAPIVLALDPVEEA